VEVIMRAQIAAAIAVLAVALAPRAVFAAQLKDFSVLDEGKKARAVFTFSDTVKAEIISHYAGNYVALSIPSLSFSKSQLKSDYKPTSKELEPVYRFIRLVQGAKSGDPGEVRLYLTKPLTPADALVIQDGKSIEIEVLKPRGSKLPEADPDAPVWPGEPDRVRPSEQGDPTDSPAEPADSGGFVPDEPPAVEPADASEGSPPGQHEAPETETNDAPGGTDAPQGDSTETGDTSGASAASNEPHTPLGQLPGGSRPHPPLERGDDENGTAPVEEPGASVDIAPSGRSYQSFDLTQVPVNGIEIRNEPFNQALMELVAGTGFNVVVGEGVSTETVTLNFARKQISLKSALDMLCTAYSLTYTVEDDGIVIRGKP
jgi:hypothetical protein